ncbi:glycosyltransferase [Bacillus sp. CGMCC 1.16607]|uniref:glycosyltransferase n=1 Tax=Bacillus sp. CGMCC 1.16607 TaxID=3351842 RepID=UPI003633551E
MRILIIGMSDSIHTARWISQIIDEGWDIHLFPSIDYGQTHHYLKNVTIHHSYYYPSKEGKNSKVTVCGTQVESLRMGIIQRLLLKEKNDSYRVEQLVDVINKIKPDIVHSLEMQAAGYLAFEAKSRLTNFPKWIVTNWGSDIYLFGKLFEHKSKIKKVLSECDYYSCECERDAQLAVNLGFDKHILPVFPNTGGFKICEIEDERWKIPTSSRKLIMLKGYQHWAGRALVGLRALERCAEILDGYRIIIYSASEDVKIAAELFEHDTGIPVTILSKETSHNEIMSYHAKARLSIGLSISDGISTSFLESIAMGAFPIQTWTSCANEWIEDGKSGILVPPNDPEVVEQAIRRVLLDDELVNSASILNWEIVKKRLDSEILKKKAIGFYNQVK